MSHTPHQHRSPDGTHDRQSSKGTKYCDVSPNWLCDGQSRKSSNNHNAQYSELHRSFTLDWHRSPDRTINHNVWLRPKLLIEGPSRRSATTVDAQDISDQHRSQVKIQQILMFDKVQINQVLENPKKCSTNHDEQWKGECQRRSCSQEWHQSPDGTYGKQSGKNTVKHDVQHSANPSSDGQLRKSTSHYAQVSGDPIRISCTPHWYSTPIGAPDRHYTKSVVDHDDNIQISVNASQCPTSHVPTTSDVSHNACTTQDVIHVRGFRKLGTKCDASQSMKILSRSNTPEGKTTRYFGMNLSNVVWPRVRTLIQQTYSTAHSIVTFWMKRKTFIFSIWRKIMDLKRTVMYNKRYHAINVNSLVKLKQN